MLKEVEACEKRSLDADQNSEADNKYQKQMGNSILFYLLEI